MIKKNTNTIELAAAKAGFSRATGYRLAADPSPPCRESKPRGRRRSDRLADIFDTEVVPISREQPGHPPKTGVPLNLPITRQLATILQCRRNAADDRFAGVAEFAGSEIGSQHSVVHGLLTRPERRQVLCRGPGDDGAVMSRKRSRCRNAGGLRSRRCRR